MKNITYLLILLYLTSCMQNKNMNSKNTFDIESVRKIISEANKLYGDRFTTNDRTWYMNRYCKDACAMPEKKNSICGIDSIMKYYYNEGNNKNLKIVIKETEIVGSQEIIVEEGIYDFPDGKGGSFDKGKFIAVWKFEDGKWKIYREIWNSSVENKND